MDTRQFIAEHLHDDVHDLALKKTPAGVDKTLALCQIEARQLLQKKVPSWSADDDLLFPPHLSIEQCSSEATAQYKASLLRGHSFADLTGGLGVDCYFISRNFQNTHYVEQNPELCALAKHNFKVLTDLGSSTSNPSAERPSSDISSEELVSDISSERPLSDIPSEELVSDITTEELLSDITSEELVSDISSERPLSDIPSEELVSDITTEELLSDITSEGPLSDMSLRAKAKQSNPTRKGTLSVINESAEDFLLHCQPLDCLFLDPARRDSHGRKTVSIADCTPNVLELQDLLLQKARRVMVKLSPMLDISLALKELRHVSEVHVVAVGNECKELLFVMEPGFTGVPVFTCVNLQSGQPPVVFTQEEEGDTVSRLATKIASYLYEPNAAIMKGGCYKLLTRRFEVMKLHRNSHLYTSDSLISDFPGRIFKVEGWAPFNKKVRQQLLQDVVQASIAVRNFPLAVSDLRKVWKIGDGDAVYLFATTMVGDRKVVIRAMR